MRFFFCLRVKRSQYSRNESLKKITGIVRLSHTLIMMEKGAIVKVYMKKSPKDSVLRAFFIYCIV